MTQDTVQPQVTPPAPPVEQQVVGQAPPSPPQTGPTLAQSPIYENYWGTDETHVHTLPDGEQSFTIKPMDEGMKAKFQKKTNKGIRVNQNTNDAHLDVDPAGERHQLIRDSVIDYDLMQLTPGADPRNPESWTQFPFSARGLDQWLERANPKTVQDLEFFIRTKNPWMQADMNVDEIDKEIERLYDLRKQAVEQQEGEGTSASK